MKLKNKSGSTRIKTGIYSVHLHILQNKPNSRKGKTKFKLSQVRWRLKTSSTEDKERHDSELSQVGRL